MPTVKMEIDTGLEYSPTDGIDASVKLHNFTVGVDGSLYKLPALKNLKNTYKQDIVISDSPNESNNEYQKVYWMHGIIDIRKFQTSVSNTEKELPTLEGGETLVRSYGYDVFTVNSFRRLVYLTTGSYGVVNIDYKGERVINELGSQSFFNEFEKNVVATPTESGNTQSIDLAKFNSKIVVDFNSQYSGVDTPPNQADLRCVFPMQYQFPGAGDAYNLNAFPRNILNCSMNPNESLNPDIQPLKLQDNDDYSRVTNDFARGCYLIGNRMVFYSNFYNKIYISKKNDYRTLAKNPEDETRPFVIVPSEEIQALTDFNGNLLTFTPSGINRWVISTDLNEILQKDPTFQLDYRVRYEGSFVVADRTVYFYTDEFHAYRINSDFSVDSLFSGELPFYKPLESYLDKSLSYPVSYFEMLGYKFVSMGPWLYNMDSQKWSTYNYDGWKNPPVDNPLTETVIWANDTAKQTISAAYDDVICTNSTICRPLSYVEMQNQEVFNDEAPSLTEGQHQWGELAFFTTRMYQDDQKFSLDGVMVYVRGGLLTSGDKLWLKVLRGSDAGDFDVNDQTTYGISSQYLPISSSFLGEPTDNYVGRFIWEGMNLKTDRFRLQIISNAKRGIVIQSVMCNLSGLSDTQGALMGKREQGDEQ